MNKQMIFESDDKIIQEDLERIVSGNVPFELLDRQTVLVTGATGLIGSEIVKAILCANRLRGTDIFVIALVKDLKKAEKIFRHVIDNKNLLIIEQNILEEIRAGGIDYIIHGASVTSSKEFVEKPVETIETAIIGTNRVLEFARQKCVKGFVYLSSLEVYGVIDSENESIREKEYGYLDPLEVRSSYSEGKRLCECLCVSYGKEYGVPVKIARLTQSFGAGVQYEDPRVFAEFARCAIEKRDIILHTKGDTVRNYCYISDAVTGILTVLLKGNCQEAYNVANMDMDLSIKEMALLLTAMDPDHKLEMRIEIPRDLEEYGYNPVSKTRLDSGKLKALGWKPEVDLEEAFRRMIQSMKFAKESEQ